LDTTSALRRPFVQLLLDRFKVTRATWPNPWALRLVDHPGAEHMNAVRLVLRDDAWIVRITDSSPVIFDVENNSVELTDAVAHPERIAAIFYLIDDRLQPAAGGGSPCETGKREFALASEAMVKTFELGTQAILDRLDGDIDALDRFFKIARTCGQVDSPTGLTFHSLTVCQTWQHLDLSSELAAYQWALSDPVELYRPSVQNLGTLVQALEDDRFEPEPFVSEPHPLAMGEGGAGDAGASAAGSGGSSAGSGGASAGGASGTSAGGTNAGTAGFAQGGR
jgi:hypothetical protein